MGYYKMQIAKCKLQITRMGFGFYPNRPGCSNSQFAFCNLHFAIVFLCQIYPHTPLQVHPESPPVDAPLVGRKEPFCGAIGIGRFQVTTSATPRQLQAGDPILLTIRIQSVGRWLQAPERPDLAHKPEYSRLRQDFHLQNGPDRLHQEKGEWEFDYSLRPKNERVKEITLLVIVYFRPGLTPAEKGYMTTSAPAIPLQVTSRTKVEASEMQGKPERKPPPETLYRINTGPKVIQSETNALPDTWLIIFLVIVPPALSLVWFVWWSRQYPNAVRRGRLRKSKAARVALRALESINGVGSQEEARQVAEVFSDYLKHRFNGSAPSLPKGPHPTGTEVFDPDLCRGITDLLGACEGVRYAPPPIPNGESLSKKAIGLILNLESRP
jgi:hypothetical protein